MQHKIFTVYDCKAEAYMQPFFSPTMGTAVRSISECVNDPQHIFGKYPADYTLFELGTFNDGKAVFTLLEGPKLIGVCLEFQNPQLPLADTPLEAHLKEVK